MLYIHIPFCRRRCSYCAFYSQPSRSVPDEYVDALCVELAQRADGHPLRTVYIGGGTPSLLTPQQLERLIRCLDDHYDTSQVKEFTLEGNPESLRPEWLQAVAQLGKVNRLSIGVQALDDPLLRTLNRLHSRAEALRAVDDAFRWGFRNLSVDLIYGLPGLSEELWDKTLQEVASWPISHLSCYTLTVEDGTLLQRQLERGLVELGSEEEVMRQYEQLLSWCSRTGWEQYEISNFCRPGCESRHNRRYWDRTPYIGLGAGAHSFDGRQRRWNKHDTRGYIEALCHGAKDTYWEAETLDAHDAYNETLMTAFRTTAGLPKRVLPPDWLQRLREDMQPFVAQGLLEETPTHIRPTPLGLLQADGISAALFVTR